METKFFVSKILFPYLAHNRKNNEKQNFCSRNKILILKQIFVSMKRFRIVSLNKVSFRFCYGTKPEKWKHNHPSRNKIGNKFVFQMEKCIGADILLCSLSKLCHLDIQLILQGSCRCKTLMLSFSYYCIIDTVRSESHCAPFIVCFIFR